jgi:hypothetical protein
MLLTTTLACSIGMATLSLGVLPLVIVDNSDFCRSRLTACSTRRILASCEVLPSPDFKQRGVVWPFTCSYVCSYSWSALSAL